MIRETTTQEIVEQYVADVLSGAVIACKGVIQCCQKYQDELSRIGQDVWPFTFDEEAADRACRFFPSLLCHSIGEYAGKPFHLSPWQMFLVWNLFGWKRPDGLRRYRKVFLSVGRKNGKSTLCAGLAIYLASADNEPGAQIFIGATKVDQARIIFAESTRMLQQSPYIAKHSTINKDNIAFLSSNSFIRPLGSDKPFDGLNPHGTFFDEIHAWREHHRPFFDTLTTGSGSRLQPVQIIITTASDDKGMIYHEERNYCSQVIAGEIADDTLFGMVFELDADDDPFADDFDEAVLIKANPGYGVSVKQEYLHNQLVEAKNKPQAKRRFIRYHGNRCISGVEDFMNAEIWDACKGKLSDWGTSDGIGVGIDLGGRDDLAAYCLSAKFRMGEDKNELPIYRYEVKSVCFIAKDTTRDLEQEPFRTWARDGKLIVCEYVISELKERLLEDCQALGVEYIAFDPYQAAHLAEQLEYEGLKPIKCPQIHSHFNEPIRDYLTAVSEGRFKPDENDELLRWCCLNATLDENNKEQIMFSKKTSREKIDACVAMVMAMRAGRLAQPRLSGSWVL